MKHLTLTEIWIYPIKSFGGIQMSAAKVLEKGLEHDRRFMLVDEYGLFITQRDFPKMALFRTSIEGDELAIRFARPEKNRMNGGGVTIDLQSEANGISTTVKVWDDSVSVFEPDPKVSGWISDHLGVRCRLVAFPEKNHRPVNPSFSINDENVSLADAFPFLLIGQSSLDDLNRRLAEPVPMNRFRPNFVFDGGEPFEEDGWKEFLIGKNKFAAVKPCARCVLTTVDQQTGEMGTEPLRTLSGFRRRDNKVLFGQNLIAVDHTVVKVGDIITLL